MQLTCDIVIREVCPAESWPASCICCGPGSLLRHKPDKVVVGQVQPLQPAKTIPHPGKNMEKKITLRYLLPKCDELNAGEVIVAEVEASHVDGQAQGEICEVGSSHTNRQN